MTVVLRKGDTAMVMRIADKSEKANDIKVNFI